MARLDHMQGGGLGIALLEADIHSVHPVIPGDAVCSLYLNGRGTLSVKRESVCGVRRGSFTAEDNSFRFTDLIHPSSPVFVRRMECFESVSFGLSAPVHVRRRLFTRKGEYSLLLSAYFGNVCITLRGKASFSADGCITFGTGKSELIICSLNGDSYAGLPGVPPPSEEVYEAVMASSDPRIKTHALRDTVNRICGGVLRDFSGCEYITREQYTAVRELCDAGLYERARGIIRFMLKIYADLGFLPISYGQKVHRDPFPEIRGAYLALALKAYYYAVRDKSFAREILPTATKALCDAVHLIKGGRLPHLGDEGVTGKAIYTPSAKSKELFSDAAKAVIAMSEEVKIRIAGIARLKNALTAMHEPAEIQRMPLRALHTFCEGCEREEVCYLGKDGRYLCPECYIE